MKCSLSTPKFSLLQMRTPGVNRESSALNAFSTQSSLRHRLSQRLLRWIYCPLFFSSSIVF